MLTLTFNKLLKLFESQNHSKLIKTGSKTNYKMLISSII